MPANRNKVTGRDLQINVADKGFYHVEEELMHFDTATGQKLSKPRMQTYTKDDWARIVSSGDRSGYRTEILHDPTLPEVVEEGSVTAEEAAAVHAAATAPASTETIPNEKAHIDAAMAEYKTLYKEDAPNGMSLPELLSEIEDRKAFLKKEEEEVAAAKAKATKK